MKFTLCALLTSVIVAGLPIPLIEEQSASDRIQLDHGKPIAEPGWASSLKQRLKRQNWGWSDSWSAPGWSQPSRNPFDICETPEGKQLGASCSGGQISTDETDGWYNEHTDVQFTSWTMGSPDKPGWNPFAPPATGVNRVGAVGGATVSGTCAGGIANNRVPVNNGGTTPMNRNTANRGRTNGNNANDKPIGGCLDLLGFATVGTNC